MTARETAIALLTLHRGACSVPRGGELEAVFAIMQMEGAVTTKDSGTVGYMDVYKKGFKPRFVWKEDQ